MLASSDTTTPQLEQNLVGVGSAIYVGTFSFLYLVESSCWSYFWKFIEASITDSPGIILSSGFGNSNAGKSNDDGSNVGCSIGGCSIIGLISANGLTCSSVGSFLS